MYKHSVIYSMRRHMIANNVALPYRGIQGDVGSD